MRAVVVGRRARRARGGARPRRRRPRRHAARGAADARRRRPDAARARGRPGAPARQRPARRARLLRGVPPLPRARRPGRLAAAAAAEHAGDRRGRARRAARRRRAARSCATATCRSRERLGVARVARRLARLDPAAHDGETFAGLLRRLGSSAGGDRPLLGRLHPAGAEPPERGGERRARRLHRADGAARRGARRAISCSRSAPLGEMHGDAAGARARGGRRDRPAAGPRRRRSRRTRPCSPTGSGSTGMPSSSRCRPPRAAALLGEPAADARGLADRERPPAVRPPDPRARRSRRCSAARRTGCSTAAA